MISRNISKLLLITLSFSVLSCGNTDSSKEEESGKTAGQTSNNFSNLVGEITPEMFAKFKFNEALKSRSEQDLESVIINFEQFISIMTESGDQGKMVAKNILEQPNVSSEFYTDFITESFNRVRTIGDWNLDDFKFKIENSNTEMNLTMHKVSCTSSDGRLANLDIIEANGQYYFGQIRF